MMMTGDPGGRPAKVGIAMNDIASGVDRALRHPRRLHRQAEDRRRRQYLETSLLEAGLAWTYWESGAYFGGGEIPTATGTRHRRSTPYQAYKTQDGYVTVGANNKKLWTAFCNITCWQARSGSTTRASRRCAARLKNIDELQDEIEKVFAHAADRALGREARRGRRARRPGLHLRAGARRTAHQGAQHGASRYDHPEDRPHEDHSASRSSPAASSRAPRTPRRGSASTPPRCCKVARLRGRGNRRAVCGWRHLRPATARRRPPDAVNGEIGRRRRGSEPRKASPSRSLPLRSSRLHVDRMCRALAYLGQPVLLDNLLYQPDSALVKQTYMPKMLHTAEPGGLRHEGVGPRLDRSRAAVQLRLHRAADVRPQPEGARREDPPDLRARARARRALQHRGRSSRSRTCTRSSFPAAASRSRTTATSRACAR